jgi:hypothetical protein
MRAVFPLGTSTATRITLTRFCRSLPRLFNGKIDKKALQAPYWQGQERQVS